MQRHNRLFLALALGLLVQVAAHGQVSEGQSQGLGYLAGGIGGDELAALRARARDYNVRIEFVELELGSQHGNWTADAAVTISSGQRQLAQIDVPGPLLYLRMPAGRYTIDAVRNGEKLSMDITAGDLAHPLLKRFVWRVAKGSLGSGLKED